MLWWPLDLWREATRVLRVARCWERAERCGSRERSESDSVSSSRRALMADELDSAEAGLGWVWSSWEACFRASRTLRTCGLSCFGWSSMSIDQANPEDRSRLYEEREPRFLVNGV